jgi:hypothetical protein
MTTAIDVETGHIIIQQPATVLVSSMSRAAFLLPPLKAFCTPFTDDGTWSLMGLTPLVIAEEAFAGTICFHGERLESVTLASKRVEFGTNLAELSKEKEQARQRFHNDWLEQHLSGHPAVQTHGPDVPAWTWSFTWGKIVSGWDTKNGTTEIVIRY